MTKNQNVSVTNISNISFSSAFCWKETFYTGSFSSCMAWHWSVCFYFVRLGNNSIEIRFSEWYMSWIINLHIPLLRLQYTYTRVYNVTASFWPHLKTLLFSLGWNSHNLFYFLSHILIFQIKLILAKTFFVEQLL